MELRLAVFAAFLVMAVTCSEARHSMRRREAEDQYDDPFLGDEGGDQQNDAGTDEDEEIVPGRIVTNSTSYNVTPGRSVRLECKVVPENAMSTGVITWSKDGTAVFIGTMKLSTDNRLSLDDTNLVIRDVGASDCAQYQCSFSQDVGSSNVTHILSVNEPPRIISFTATDNGSVPQGANLLLTCSVTGYPEPKIIWSVDRGQGNGLLKETDGEFSPNSVFIPNVTRNHSGRYYCYSVNNLGNSTAEVVVNVIAPPRVHVKHPIKNSALRVPAELECSVHESYPVPHIRWYKDGVLVEESTSRYVVSTNGFKSNLTVTPEREEDFGTFTCAAESRHGTHNKSIDLVEDPVVTSLSSQGPSLSWSVDSHQPLEAVELQVRSMDEDADFRLITVPLPESPAHSYVFSQRLDKDLKPGRYEATVKVKNSHSWNKNIDPTFVEIIGFGPESITGASVYRGLGSNADSIQTTFVSTILMYLLVRMM